ncbi:PREDICTED: mitotic spindle checkpoint protein MAD1 isoform X3 [Populus euphratica]|uniref:Mitotic spindle checkpoint protein MAD1 isoform X3 n=1 Tax=Populus euphratica TaxID=75702 RepID=A0AAJ6XRB2_POPEU|nr:PREDICTED: mitotic spindle checkpoint protein MAD1 isoform X3 [Populus euphratica]
MILRTPPEKRTRGGVADANAIPIIESPQSDHHHIIINEDNNISPLQPSSPEQLLCTYQCRQMVKSDFIDALSSAGKQARDYQSKLEGINENFTKSEDEKKFRDKLLQAEQELAAAKGREQALQNQLAKEVNDNQERFKKQLESQSKLEVNLENEKNLRQKAESSAASAEEKASVLEGKLIHLSESIEREKKRPNNELEQMNREPEHSVSRISAELEKMECRAQHAEKESELLKEQLKDLRRQLTEESEVREARKLRSSHENIELLKEKLIEEKGWRERAESELSKLLEFELNMKKLEDELSSWKSVIKDIPGVSCYDDIPAKFAALQKEVIDNMMKIGEVNALLKQMEVALDTAQLGKQNAETEAALAKEKAEALTLEVKEIELMLSMVTEERDRLKNVVNELKRPKDDRRGDATTSGVLQELESSLVNKGFCIQELENNLHAQKEVNNRQLEEIKTLNDMLNNEARRIKSLERESDRLRVEISLLESKLGHGDFSAANTKVLRMFNTLAVDNEAKQSIEALRTELQKTKEKLQAVEELKSQSVSGDTGKLVDSYISGKITQLKEQIATLEKREERYKTVFADRISVFRRACCELFGYKIVMDEHQRSNGIPVTRFTLQSVYAQSDDEKLEFEYESGNTNILANDYTSQPDISRQADIFIRKMNSIPAFTANLTVESFNRRTLS